MKKKVLLINYAGYWITGNTFVPDNSLATLAAVLNADGWPVEIMDFHDPVEMGSILEFGEAQGDGFELVQSMNRREPLKDSLLQSYFEKQNRGARIFEDSKIAQILGKIATEDIGFIGFKLWIGPGIPGSISIAQKIRENFPKVKLYGGGPAIQYLQEHFYKYSDVFDALVYNDGEMALLSLVRGESEPPNTIMMRDSAIQKRPRHLETALHDIPAPLYDAQIYPNADNMFHMRIIDDSRGCFNNCAFCTHPILNGRRTRAKAASQIVDEIQEYNQKQGIRFFRLSGSNPPRKFVNQIAEEIIKRKLDINYSIFSSFNNTDPLDYPRLRESGLTGLFFGIETGDPTFLKKVHNKFNKSADFMVSACQQAMEQGIFLSLSVIYPSPFEEERTRTATMNLLKRIFEGKRLGSVLVCPAFLSPESQWWNSRETYGFEFEEGVTESDYLMDMIDWTPNFLLPRTAARSLKLKLNGKSFSSVFLESQKFIEELEREGIETNVDDATYMLSLMSGYSPKEFKKMMMEKLLVGGRLSLKALVDEINVSAKLYTTPRECGQEAPALSGALNLS